MLSIGIPVVLLMAFLGIQFLGLDSIGWHHGFEHPLTGWDHLVTMLAVGIWAAQLRGKAIWMLPASFVGVMSLGGLAGAAGISLPSVEGIILLSCAVFGVLITRRVRFSAKVNVLIVAFFAFFHGFAHGQEISTSASLISYTLGFMLATLLLHGAGILFAKLVVLSITCLLTAMFSSSALAKAMPFSASGSSSTNIVKCVSKNSLSWFGSEQLADSNTYQSFVKDRLRSEQSPPYATASVENNNINIKLGFLTSGLPDLYLRPLINKAEKLKISGDMSGFLPLTTSEDVLTQALAFVSFQSIYRSPAILQFKHYFPDINHTPGKHLLSNGVGLTSPPVANTPSLAVPQTVSSFCNTPIQLPEVHPLQSTIAKTILGKFASQFIQDPCRSGISCDFSQNHTFKPFALSAPIDANSSVARRFSQQRNRLLFSDHPQDIKTFPPKVSQFLSSA